MKKIAVITGAASGIGLALCQELQNHDYQIVALDKNAEALGTLNTEFKKYPIDVSVREDFLSVGEKIRQEVGRPDLWINCAGMAVAESFEEQALEKLEKVIQVNYLGVAYGMKAAMLAMGEPWSGVIVNIASVSGMIPSPYLASYSASKAAVIALTRSVQDELKLKKSPLKIILVSPGFVRTPIMEQGPRFAFPKHMEWLRATPKAAAADIVSAIERGEEEVLVGMSGKIFEKLYKHTPGLFRLGGRMLFAQNWKEVLGLEKIQK